MIRFEFRHDLRAVPYAMFREDDEVLFVVGLPSIAWMPTWLREHLSNAVTAHLDGPGGRVSQPTNVIDFTAARALRADKINTERKGEAHDGKDKKEAPRRCAGAAERPLPGSVSGHE